jgi:hypothetical protein
MPGEHAHMNVCIYGGVYEMWRGMICTLCNVWQVAGSSTLSYCKGRVPYRVSGMKIYSSVQEEGDCASIALGGSLMESAPSPLQQGHTDRQTDRRRLATQGHTDRQPMPREPHTMWEEENKHICMYVCMYTKYSNR